MLNFWVSNYLLFTMENCVLKRNLDKELYSADKLVSSLKKAFKSVKVDFNSSTLKSIINDIKIENDISTSEIRDQLEFSLMEHGYYNVAKSFIRYGQNKIAEERDIADKISFVEQYCSAINSASGSKYDSNANVDNKNIATLSGELPKSNFIKVNRKLLYNKIKKLYNKKTADQYIKMLKEHFIYKNDETGIANYCASITMYPWLLEGAKPIGGNSTAPTNLKAFCGGFVNLVFIVSSMLSGACLYKNQTLSVKEDEKYTDYSAKDFISKFNLTNTFDNYQGKWEYANVSDKNMFIRDGDNETKITKVYRRTYSDKIYRIKTSKGHTLECSKDHKIMTVSTHITGSFCNAVEYDIPVENLHVGSNVFIETDMSNCPDHDYNGEIHSVYFESGYRDDTFDKYNTKLMYDYQFDTISEIETFDNDDEYVYEIETESHYYNVGGIRTHNCATPEFLMYLNYFIEKEYGNDYYLNAKKIVDLSLKQRTIDKIIIDCFEQIIYSINQPTGARNFQSVFWNIAYYDRFYFESLFGNFVFPDGTKPNWESLSWLQKRFMVWFNKERTKTLLTFPVETMAMLSEKYEDGTYDIKDKEYAEFVSKMYSEGHSFFTYLSDNADSLSSCCRLRNQITDNEFSYTLGAGGVSTGSKSVLTINLNRCIQYAAKNNIDYLTFLEEVIDLCHKAQIAYNDNLKELQNKGMLPLFDAGYININRQYLTIGINGLVEAAEFLGLEINDNEKYANYVQSVLGLVETYNKKYRSNEIMMNCEMIPAENVGVKHAHWDKEDGYQVNRNCYNSYFYKVEDQTLNIIDKIKLHGKKYIEHLTGGSALHLNLEEHLTKQQYRQLLKVAAQEGCNYLTFNIPNTVCNSCGNIDKRYLHECPKCHSKDIDFVTRIIGYIKRISNFSLPRQEEAKQRYYINEAHNEKLIALQTCKNHIIYHEHWAVCLFTYTAQNLINSYIFINYEEKTINLIIIYC